MDTDTGIKRVAGLILVGCLVLVGLFLLLLNSSSVDSQSEGGEALRKVPDTNSELDDGSFNDAPDSVVNEVNKDRELHARYKPVKDDAGNIAYWENDYGYQMESRFIDAETGFLLPEEKVDAAEEITLPDGTVMKRSDYMRLVPTERVAMENRKFKPGPNDNNLLIDEISKGAIRVDGGEWSDGNIKIVFEGLDQGTVSFDRKKMIVKFVFGFEVLTSTSYIPTELTDVVILVNGTAYPASDYVTYYPTFKDSMSKGDKGAIAVGFTIPREPSDYEITILPFNSFDKKLTFTGNY